MSRSISTEQRASAVRYWESRRLGFNLMLVPPGVCGWLGYLSTAVGLSDLATLEPMALILPLLLAIAAANVLYSAVYGIEYLLLGDGQRGFSLARGRDTTFAAGCVAVFGLAFLGGAGFAAHLVAVGQ